LQRETLDDTSKHASRGRDVRNICGFGKARDKGARQGHPYIEGIGKLVIDIFAIFKNLLIVT
jgi:hypothetical protein